MFAFNYHIHHALSQNIEAEKMRLPVVVLELVAELTVRLLLVGVVLVVATVVVVVEGLSALLGLVLGTLTVNVVGTLGLSKAVNLTGSETGKEFLGELVRDWLACSKVSNKLERKLLGVS